MDKKQYNRNYYERHKEKIKEYQRLKRPKPTPASIEAHRKAARAYYYRQKERKELQELEAKKKGETDE